MKKSLFNLCNFSSDKNIQGPANGTLQDIHAYAKGKIFFSFVLLWFFFCNLENTKNLNSPHSQQILKSEPKTWQESLYKFYS